MTDFKKIVRLGTKATCGGRWYSVYCTIEYKDGRLSISGVEGPTNTGNCLGGCGQIVDHLDIKRVAPGWSRATIEHFQQVWNRWHLNDMRSGTKAQMDALKPFYESNKYPDNDYTHACEYLDKLGLLVDNGYKYGSAWLKVEVPQDVIEYLQSLPDADKVSPWGGPR